MFHSRTMDAANGKWRGILMEFGVPESALRDRHGPCPLCGGTDRFRWDNQDGRGTYICNSCGAGDGMKLAMEFTGEDFKTVASRIDQMLGNIKFDGTPQRPRMSGEDRRRMLREIWSNSQPIAKEDLVDRYLANRNLEEPTYPGTLRFAPALRDGEGGVRPAMIAAVGIYGAPRFVSIHRTFLKPDGSGKAEMASPRKLTPGELPDGACVSLSEYTSGVLGIAEGIETAMAASIMYEMPVWSALNSTLLKKWVPPDGCEDVVIFADNDLNHAGQAAAYELAHRLSAKGTTAQVMLPEEPGTDFADVYQNHQNQKEQQS